MFTLGYDTSDTSLKKIPQWYEQDPLPPSPNPRSALIKSRILVAWNALKIVIQYLKRIWHDRELDKFYCVMAWFVPSGEFYKEEVGVGVARDLKWGAMPFHTSFFLLNHQIGGSKNIP